MSAIATPAISRTVRLASMLVDHFVMSVLAVVFGLPLFALEMFSGFDGNPVSSFAESMGPLEYISYIGFALYFCKDCLHGRSIAKRIFGLQVVNNDSGTTASPLSCLIRNLFGILWPIEVVVSFFDTSRRLGDRIAGTRLVKYDNSKVELPFKPPQIIFSLILAYAFMFALMFVIHEYIILGSGKHEYVKSSYNRKASRQMQKLFKDSLQYNTRTEVEVYDSTTTGAAHYISMQFHLNNNYLKDGETKRKITQRIKDILYDRYDPDSLHGDLELIYKEIGHVESQKFEIGNYVKE
jgi:uncharacterized RDD family membrane protein YckC